MKPNASLPRASGIIMKNAKASKDFDVAVIHADGNKELVLSHGPAQQVPRVVVKPKHVRNFVKLRLSHFERIQYLIAHRSFPFTRQTSARYMDSRSFVLFFLENTPCHFKCQGTVTSVEKIPHLRNSSVIAPTLFY
jgi:hypothetical protein